MPDSQRLNIIPEDKIPLYYVVADATQQDQINAFKTSARDIMTRQLDEDLDSFFKNSDVDSIIFIEDNPNICFINAGTLQALFKESHCTISDYFSLVEPQLSNDDFNLVNFIDGAEKQDFFDPPAYIQQSSEQSLLNEDSEYQEYKSVFLPDPKESFNTLSTDADDTSRVIENVPVLSNEQDETAPAIGLLPTPLNSSHATAYTAPAIALNSSHPTATISPYIWLILASPLLIVLSPIIVPLVILALVVVMADKKKNSNEVSVDTNLPVDTSLHSNTSQKEKRYSLFQGIGCFILASPFIILLSPILIVCGAALMIEIRKTIKDPYGNRPYRTMISNDSASAIAVNH